jgi:hypothetical protein
MTATFNTITVSNDDGRLSKGDIVSTKQISYYDGIWSFYLPRDITAFARIINSTPTTVTTTEFYVCYWPIIKHVFMRINFTLQISVLAAIGLRFI